MQSVPVLADLVYISVLPSGLHASTPNAGLIGIVQTVLDAKLDRSVSGRTEYAYLVGYRFLNSVYAIICSLMDESNIFTQLFGVILFFVKDCTVLL